ncbi:hypothetical protein SJU92_03890 [Aeromonas caviae]|uniref:hypothetical protein n=1 Tax=Aeromonas caviae TaxID=648 RepID=UPI0029D4C3D5|nr:hypothetical protein [Aeromonas caviae]MDX7855156.1 hypothetical protein [Aeromonas caviae]
MYWPDTNTGVDVEPTRKPVASAVRKFFTEGGVGQAPTVPGGDWFNQVTNELLNVLAAAGIDPSKTDDEQLLAAINVLIVNRFSGVDGASNIGSASYSEIRLYSGNASQINCYGKNNVFDGCYGLFMKDDSDTSSLDDDVMVIIDALGRRWKRQHAGPLLPRFAGVVGDGIVDDYAACEALIAAFKQRGSSAPGGIDMGGDGIDWTGFRCRLSQKLDLSGLFNYSFTNPSFIAHSTFTGTALLRIDSDHTYLASGITWINPQLDAAWIADYCVEAFDFLKWTMVGGKFSHYKKKGFITGTVHDAPHEINAIGTFFFQREYNETFPPSVTEGEAFEINNYDNYFTGIVVGYQKLWALTLNKGSNKFVGGHLYTGLNSATEGGVRSYDVGNDFIGVYFDYTWIRLAARNSVQGCQFGVNDGGKAIFITVNPFQTKVTNNRFNKTGTTSNVIDMPTIAGGRVARPNIYDNEYNGCTGITTSGAWYQSIGAAVVTVPVPDEFLPLSSFGMPGRSAQVSGSHADKIFGASYNSTTREMTINCYQVTSGTLAPATLGGGSVVIDMNT